MDVQEQLRRDTINRLLSAANLSKRRLDWEDALRKCQEALALDPNSAEAHELVGDVFQAEGKWEEALSAYKTAQQIAPHRSVLEEKIGLVSIELDALAREEAWREEIRQDPSQLYWEERSPKVAALLSGVIPGGGQFYNGDIVRGAVMLGVFLGGLLMFLIATGSLFSAAHQPQVLTQEGFSQLQRQVQRQVEEQWSVSRMLWVMFSGMLYVVAWGVSLIEAPLRAARRNRERRRELGLE